jgi:hypothetical protein
VPWTRGVIQQCHCWHLGNIEAVKLNVRFGVPFGHIQTCSNSIEDAHLINMSTFEADEHLQARCLLPRLPRLGRNGARQIPPRLIWLPCH